ncbi:leucine-rich repeat-containing protein 40 [Festucalex cinctus]
MSRSRGAQQVDSLRGFRTPESEPSVPSGLLKAARQSGTLNLTNRNLSEVPTSVYRLNVDTPEEAHRNVSFGASDRWWEQTDLTKLLLASNRLTRLSDDIRLLPALTTLDLHDNQLETLPGALGDLQELQQLRVGHNRLTCLPPEVYSLRNLRSLTLQQNLLDSLPEDLGRLEALTELDVSDNQLTELPSGLGRLSGLQKLHLCRNKLTCLPDSLRKLTNVKLLDCSNNLLSDVPAGVSQMAALEQLYLRHNKLRHLPPLRAPALKELYLGNNQIADVSGERMSGLGALAVLELRDNKIATLPDEVTALGALARLDLTNNDIGVLPAALGLLPELKILLLEGNPLRGIRRDLLTKGTNELLKYLRGRIKEEPDSAGGDVPTAMTLPSQAAVNLHSIKTLKSLVYSDKKAELIPDELFQAAAEHAVTSADLSKNLLSDVPPRLAETRASLMDLNMAFNKLSCCSLVCSLTNLRHLDLRNNQLGDLPSDLNNLSKLHSLVLNCNKFKSFPEVLYDMPSLESVLLGNNQVGDVDPARLLRLVRLSTLDLSNNDLLNVPPQLGLCTTLRCLSLEGNPFRSPRAAIVAKGTDAILEYLRSRIPT